MKKDPGVLGEDTFRDARAHASFVLYPQPFGLQAEYNVGVGPEYRDGAVVDGFLHGGYVMAMLKLGDFVPF
ncbi:hypothetical protein KK466_29560, partial [Klebsiella pneumoniae]|uniref:hypothetical protein n=1 Tax=Klebsiella pneumoniae TaxID=573 RepID=UPI001BE06E71